jgi:hypothetical protein
MNERLPWYAWEPVLPLHDVGMELNLTCGLFLKFLKWLMICMKNKFMVFNKMDLIMGQYGWKSELLTTFNERLHIEFWNTVQWFGNWYQVTCRQTEWTIDGQIRL